MLALLSSSDDFEIGSSLTEQGGPFDDESILLAQSRLKELLRAIAFHYDRKGELFSAAIYAMTSRHLSPHYKMGDFNPHVSSLHGKINNAFGLNRYAYHAIDSLLKKLKSVLAAHRITDAPIC